MSITENIKQVRTHIPANVDLVCVSKFHPAEAIQEAYQAGERIFGESRVQELCAKHPVLPADIQWHFIGHLQTNKIKYIAPFVSLIHGVDSAALLAAINREALKSGRVIDCLLQVHIAREETKFGFSPEELIAFLADEQWQKLSSVRICGLMGMASNTSDEAQVANEFEKLHQLFVQVKQTNFADHAEFARLSMGMSHDYRLAMAHGSTMVRIGTSIFGERVY